MRSVRVKWNWISWENSYCWRDDIIPQLEEKGLTERDLATCVYVIVADGLFAIDYPKKASPTLYIGSGNFKNRLAQHESWLGEITALVHDYSFSIAICTPKVKGISVHRDMEAALIHKFIEMYGCIPIRNQRIENPLTEYNYLPENVFRKPLMIGRGFRYHWAIKPLKANRYYKSYCSRTNSK